MSFTNKKDIEVSSELLAQYKKADEYIIVNDNDIDLHPIKIQLPVCPPLDEIDGYGLPVKEQYFRPPEMPKKLLELVNNSSDLQEIWSEIDKNRKFYRDEIIWLNHQWYYRLNGYWFFNKGKPTYMDGWHWMYCSWWNLDVGIPEYRDRDRIFFIFARYCYTTTTATFFWRIVDGDNIEWLFSTKKEAQRFADKNSIDSDIEEGEWEVDYERRVCLGFNYPKHRREGATYKAAMINYEIISRTMNANGGIQSMDEASAKDKVFIEKIINPFKKLPFFFVPEYDTSLTSPQVIRFNKKVTAKRKGSSSSNISTGLQSVITSGTSADRYYDGTKLYMHHGDETGKGNQNAPYDVGKRHEVIRKCLAQGAGKDIIGLAINTSTVSDTKGDYGFRYMQLCKKSHWEQRDQVTGQTQTGMFNLFISAEYCLEGFVDRYGEAVIETPTPSQSRHIKSKYGSREHLQRMLAQQEADPIAYYETLREAPTKFRHCFMTASGDSGFNLNVISERISEIDMGHAPKPRQGNFYRDDLGVVKFIDNIDGKFFVSYIPERTNQFFFKNGIKFPTNYTKFYASADPFMLEKTKSGNRSLAGGAVFMDRDITIDSEKTDVADYKTNRFVCTYLNRVPTQDEFCDDMAMMCEFYGCRIFPENNVDEVERYFLKHDLVGYLQYTYEKGKRSKRAGFRATHQLKQEMFSLYIKYIEHHGVAEVHREVLEDCRDIQGLDDTRNFDRFVACGGCLLARRFASNVQNRVDDEEKEDSLVAGILRTRRRI